MSDSQPTVQFYGTTWCGTSRRVRQWFDENHIPYAWIDVDKDKAAEDLVKSINKGMRSVPTIVFADGSHLTEPSIARLEQKARELGLLAA